MIRAFIKMHLATCCGKDKVNSLVDCIDSWLANMEKASEALVCSEERNTLLVA